jgi:excinuclease UvrABC nuclease subunit
LTIEIIESLEKIWPDNSGTNDYSCLTCVQNKYGVYIFRDPNNGSIFYIGEAHEQDIKTRVKQNFTENDTGGTFRKNYMEKEGISFDEFKSAVKNKHLICITLDKSILIKALESLLINVLKPTYNKDV